MKRMVMAIAAVMAIGSTMAQKKESDTIKVGNYVIIKNSKEQDEEDSIRRERNRKTLDFEIEFNANPRRRNLRNVSTNWGILDIGFANYRDQTLYPYAQGGTYLRQLRLQDGLVDENSNKLNITKSSNVNIWIFMQKLNLVKHKINLKYGLGYEMYNFRFERSLSYRNNPTNYIFNDSINFSKNKLFVGYATVPIMINFQAQPEKRRSFSMSIGVSAGYLLGARNKQISSQRGKEKLNSTFDLEPFRLAAIGEVGFGPVRLYGSYSFNQLHKSSTRIEQYPYALGIRFSNW